MASDDAKLNPWCAPRDAVSAVGREYAELLPPDFGIEAHNRALAYGRAVAAARGALARPGPGQVQRSEVRSR